MSCTGFNTQPPEGGWTDILRFKRGETVVSTHSRPKAAGLLCGHQTLELQQFQHTAARRRLARADRKTWIGLGVSTHSRPKAAGLYRSVSPMLSTGFQHTAARRRLDLDYNIRNITRGFNTQPPEGGWVDTKREAVTGEYEVSTHSRPKAAGKR